MATNAQRNRRHRRVRARVSGTAERPRVCVFRSNVTLYAQVIDDVARHTLVSRSAKELKGTKTEQSAELGVVLSKALREKGVSAVVFDRAGYRYHGRVRAFAEGLRSGGLQF